MANVCVACPAGLFNDVGDDASGPDTSCEADSCGQNERVVKNQCVPCEPGSVAAAGADPAGKDTNCTAVCSENERAFGGACAPCPAGTVNEEGDLAAADTTCDPVLCALNRRVVSHQCTMCEPGTNNAAGDDASGQDTTCDPIICAANEHVQNNRCVACPSGATRPAGDDASGPNTTCVATICAENEFVQASQCLPCPPNTVRAAGDDATGPDTMCDPVLCLANERVQNNNCVSCPAGFVRGAGDDPTGPDTECEVDCVPIVGVTCDEFNDAYIKASNPDEFDEFGRAIAMDGTTLVVGAPFESSSAGGIDPTPDNFADNAGAVYVFTRDAGGWSQQAYLKPSVPSLGSEFGTSVAIDGDTIVVGARYHDGGVGGINSNEADTSQPDSGAAYVFHRTNTTWSQEAFLKAASPAAAEQLGGAVAIDGDTVVAGASPADGFVGAAYVFTRNGTTWSQQARLTPSVGAEFGTDVAISADTIAAGAPGSGGRVLVFTRTGGVWTERVVIDEPNPASYQWFGYALGLDAGTLVVSSYQAGFEGAVRVFTGAAASWSLQSEFESTALFFGNDVAIDGDTLVVGSPNNPGIGSGLSADPMDTMGTDGGVFVYERTGNSWAQYCSSRRPTRIPPTSLDLALR